MPDTAPTYSLDGAVAFMDTDTTEGNNSLCVNRQLESYGNFSGSEGNASYGLPVTVVTGLDPHQLSGVITSTFTALNRVFSGCINPPNQYTKLTYMIQIEVPEGFCFTNGDSGAAVLDSAGRLIAIYSASPNSNLCIGYAQLVWILKATFGLDGWYGINTSSSPTLCN